MKSQKGFALIGVLVFLSIMYIYIQSNSVFVKGLENYVKTLDKKQQEYLKNTFEGKIKK